MTHRSPTDGAPATGGGGAVEVLGRRALNRATLERQLLLRRAKMSALDAIRHLVGLQAQAPNPPYVGLWTRLEDFRHDDLTRLLYERRAVRSSMMRGTQHLVSASDFPWLRPLVQSALDGGRQAAFGRRTAGMDLAELAAAGRALLEGRTLTRPRLGELLAERWPVRDPEALAWSVQCLVPLVHTPPNGTWGRGGATPFTLAEDWLGRPMEAEPPPKEMVRRYLAAFGPASVADVQAWSGLTRLGGVLEALRPELRVFRDGTGTELFDLPGAPLPDPETPAPARFLPAYDNLVLSHADRARVIADEHRGRVITGSLVRPTFLLDGFVRGTWKTERTGGKETLVIEPFEALPEEDREALSEQGGRLARFVGGGAVARR